MPILAEEPCLYPESLLDDREGELDDGERNWWLVYTKARQEKALARQLLLREIPYYLPLVPKDNLIRGRRVRSHLPLFTGYMFLFADETERTQSLTTNRISQIHMVTDPLQLLYDLQQIHRLIAADALLTLERKLAPGQVVRVRTGPFKGTTGVLVSRRGDTKLLVAVDFLGQGVTVEIDDFQLEAA